MVHYTSWSAVVFLISSTPPVNHCHLQAASLQLDLDRGTTNPATANVVAVDNSPTATNGRIYVAAFGEGTLYAYESDGEEAPDFPIRNIGFQQFVVESTSGNFWIADNNVSEQFTSQDLPTGRKAMYDVEAVDSEGDVYTQNGKFNPFDEFLYQLPTPGSMAVEPATNNVYISQGSEMNEYDGAGTKIATVFEPEGIALGPIVVGASDTIYAVASGRVDIFGPGNTVTIPQVTTDPGSDYQETSVILHGTVEPEGVTTTKCLFEWGESTNYGNRAPCEPGEHLEGSGDLPVTAHLTGLTQGGTYHYRLVAANANEDSRAIGLDATAIPAGAPVVRGPYYSTNVHSDTAEVHADIDPEGGQTTYQIEYGETVCAQEPGRCETTSAANAGSEQSTKPIFVQLLNLNHNATYHYRIVATNQAGTVYGPEGTFTTFHETEF